MEPFQFVFEHIAFKPFDIDLGDQQLVLGRLLQDLVDRDDGQADIAALGLNPPVRIGCNDFRMTGFAAQRDFEYLDSQ